MFRLAERRACRHQALSRQFGEALEPCAATVEAPSSAGSPLFQKQRKLRKQLADARHVPAYMVFNDATLQAMAAARPQDEDGLPRIPGVGPKKWTDYGEIFLSALRDG